MQRIKFAIIADNVLTCLGLKGLMTQMMPFAEVVVCESFQALEKEDAEDFLHFFVSSRIYFEHTQWFRRYPHKSIVLVNGSMMISDVFTLNVYQSEAGLIRDMIALQSQGHSRHASGEKAGTKADKANLLSQRETEVAVLLCKGLINKEIADRMNIAVATVISHRKSIMEKLQANSLVDVIIHCVVNGIVSIEDL